MQHYGDNKVKILSRRSSAFSLVEIAIVLIVVGALLSLSVPLMQSLRKSIEHTKENQIITDAQQLLAAFVLKHGHFPCPSENVYGSAVRNCRHVSIASGFFPYHTLNSENPKLSNAKAVRYAVVSSLTQNFMGLQAQDSDESSSFFCGYHYTPSIMIQKSGSSVTTPPENGVAFLVYIAEADTSLIDYSRILSQNQIPAPNLWATRDNFMATIAKSPCV